MNNLVRNAELHYVFGTVIEEGTRGVLLRNGRYRETLEPGRYWTIPGIDQIKTVDIKPQIMSVPMRFISRDQYNFAGDLAIFYNVSDPKDVALMAPQDFQQYLERYINLELRDELSHNFSLNDHLDEQNPRHLMLDSVDAIKEMFDDRGVSVYDIGMVILPPKNLQDMHMRRLEAEYERMTAPIEAEADAREYWIRQTAHRENRLAYFRGIMDEVQNIEGPAQYLIAMGLFGRGQTPNMQGQGLGGGAGGGIQEGIGDSLYAELIGDQNLTQVALRRGLGQNGIAVFSLGDLLSGRGVPG